MPLRFLTKLLSRQARPAPGLAVSDSARDALIEPLEQRLALYADPFLANLPDLGAMRNTNDTIVRFLTTQGVIDIEIYDRGGPPAVVTAANFIKYVTSGRYDNTFFHRSIANFVLQGGGFVDDPTTVPPATIPYSAVVTDPPIVNEYSDLRKNEERTIAMAKLGGNPDSATSQFFFNLQNNLDLNSQNGGFTVFGKVIQGWSVVETIENFQTRNLNSFLGGDAFDSVPLSGTANTDLIRIIDAEIIKAPDQTAFYTETLYFPDGFRSGRIVSTVELANLDPNAGSLYQIIVRYETKTRDTVVSSGSLTPGAHLDVPISKAGQPSLNLVKAGNGFSYVIRSTKPLGATLHHRDFNADASESFLNANPYTADQLKQWTFAGAQKGPGRANFVVWKNLASVINTLTITIYPETGGPLSLTKTLQPFRRGGLDLSQITGLPDGTFTINISSTQPIVASLSQFHAAAKWASMELGTIGGGNTEGILPAAYISSSGQAIISATRLGDVSAAITLDFQFILSDGSVFSNNGTITFTTGQRARRWDLSTLNGALPRNEYFTIRYKVRDATAPIVLTYLSIVDGDTIATAFQTGSTKNFSFGGGFTSTDAAAQGNETITLFNPYDSNAVQVSYRLRFHFVDSSGDETIIPAGGTGTLTPNQHLSISVRSLSEIIQRITTGTQFRSYSISIETDVQSAGSSIDGAVFAQLTRLDPEGATLTYGPTLNSTQPLFLADNSAFGSP